MSYSSRERVLAALNHETPDRVPTALWGSWYGVTDRLYFNLLDALGWQPVAPFRPDLVHSVNYYDDRLLEHLGTDVRHVDPGSTASTSKTDSSGADAWGLLYDRSGLYRMAKAFPLAKATADQIYAHPFPTPDAVLDADVRSRLAEIRKMPGEYAISGRAVASYGFFEMAESLRGHDTLLVDLIESPDVVEAIVARLLDCYSGMILRFLEVADGTLDLLELPGDDYAGNKHPIISPRLFDRFFRPAYASLLARIREAAPATKVVFHSDGAIKPFIPRLIEMGFDVVHPLEPLPATDQGALKAEFGDRIAFLGGVDIREALQRDEASVVAEVRTRIEQLAPGGGYILAPSNHLQWDVPPANVFALFRTAREYGKY